METRVIDNEELFPVYGEILASGKSVCVQVVGNSMLPWVRSRKDRVELLARESYGVGDIVLFQADNGRYILHRILRVEGGRMLTQGDGNPCPDGWNSMDHILGVVTRFERWGRFYRVDQAGVRAAFWLWLKLSRLRMPLLRLLGLLSRLKARVRGHRTGERNKLAR